MAKKTLLITINSSKKTSYEVSALINDNKIVYYEPDKTKAIYDYLNITLKRDNSNYNMFFNFPKNEATLFDKKLKKYINLPIKTTKIVNNKDNIFLKYCLNKEEFTYQIEVLK